MTKVFFEKAIRLFKFSLSTLAGTAVDMLVLWIFKQFVFKDWYYGEYMISPVISFFFAVLTNFSLAYFIVWKDRVSKRSIRSFFRHFAGYGISSLGGFIVKMGLLLLIFELVHIVEEWFCLALQPQQMPYRRRVAWRCAPIHETCYRRSKRYIGAGAIIFSRN